MAAASLKAAQKLILAAIETTYGTDAEPTAALNAIETYDTELSVIEGATERPELDREVLGNAPEFHTSLFRRLRFKVPMAGAGNPGDVPGYDPLLQICGRARVENAGVDVQYPLISSGFPSGTLYFNWAGNLYRMLGVRSTCDRMLSAKGMPYFMFDMMGLFVQVAPQALPSDVDKSAFVQHVPVNATNTTGFSLHGVSPGLRSLTLTDGNQLEPIDIVGCKEVAIPDRAPAGSITIEETSAATKNWDTVITEHQTGALTIQHGQTAGNILEFQRPAVQLLQPNLGEDQKRVTRTMNLNPLPVDGDDEDLIIVR